MHTFSSCQDTSSNFISLNSDVSPRTDNSSSSQTNQGVITIGKYNRDYIQLAENVGNLLRQLKQQASSLRKSIVATLLMGTTSPFRSEILGEDVRYAGNACRKTNAASLSKHPLFTQKRSVNIGKKSVIRDQELSAFSSTYANILTSRSGAKTEYFSISDHKDYFYLKYRYHPMQIPILYCIGYGNPILYCLLYGI